MSVPTASDYIYSQDHNAILERVLYSFSLALLLLIIALHNKLLSLTLLVGSIVALWSSVSYLSKELYKSHHLYDIAVRTLKRRGLLNVAND